ncbi:MAG: hypothetical protein FIB08_07415 [Candidatus Methanoperedens sp.]|nr:hypothetical protein [Candidatus Methanoperedens sp.]
MKINYILSVTVFLILIMAGISPVEAYAGETRACNQCHQYPPKLINISANITSITVNPGQLFTVNISWSGGNPSGNTEINWPSDFNGIADKRNNSQFNFAPSIPASGFNPNGTALTNLTAPGIPGSYIVRVYATTGSWGGNPKETNYTDVEVTVLEPVYGAPHITGFSPSTATVTNNAGESRAFSIITNQTVNVTWLINGTQVQPENISVSAVSYTNTNATQGAWNVTAIAENKNGTSVQKWDWIVVPATPGSPGITGYGPTSPVKNNAGATGAFNVTLNQTSNITWYLNGTQVQFNENVTEARYTNTSAGQGFWNITAIAQNVFGTVRQTWDWIISLPIPATGAPKITGFDPASSAGDTAGMTRAFTVTVNQTANVTWLINGTQVQFNESVTEAKYTNTSAATGSWNVTAVAGNKNGNDMKVWDWSVSPAAPAYGAPAITGYNPASLVSDTAGDTRSFRVTLNQTANVTWYINGTQVQLNESTTSARYTNTSASKGIWIVKATATNPNGIVSKEWTWTVTKYVPAEKIIAGVDIKPETLNLASRGTLKAFITLPDGYDVKDIDLDTVRAEGARAVKGEISNKGGGTLIVTFNRQDMAGVPAGNDITVWVTGKIRSNGVLVGFEGSDEINVLDSGNGKRYDDDEDNEDDDEEYEHGSHNDREENEHDEEDDEEDHASIENANNGNTVNINIEDNYGEITINNNFYNNVNKNSDKQQTKGKNKENKKKSHEKDGDED